ncbi:MAG: Fe3+/spermidine/putrescine ABC transporter ATP-binding protein [Rhodobacteraceae bacterium]|nr:Fe3+/spermidine/putrescine ABC transporter ATP-binding protein [Paracoccaceae bacterium]
MSLNNSLQLINICKSFGTVSVVQNLNLALFPGKITCLLGPSGCGKSTTLRIAAGLEKQDLGKVYLNGKLISSANSYHLPPEKRNMGFMFQDFALFPHLNVKRNIEFAMDSSKNLKSRSSRSNSLLSKIGLEGFQTKFPHMLSGGEQQRVALARAVAGMPKVMLMDEPFSGLDKRLRDEIRDETLTLMKEEGTAVLLVTHEPEEAMKMADSIALMRAGEIVQQGAPYNIYNKPVDSKAAAFFSDINMIVSKVKSGRTETPFGPFITPGLDEGSEVEIIIRPQHLKIDFDRNGRGPDPTIQDGVPARGFVRSSRFLGKESIVELIMESDNSQLKASIPGVFLPDSNTPLWLSMKRDRCYVFLKKS